MMFHSQDLSLALSHCPLSEEQRGLPANGCVRLATTACCHAFTAYPPPLMTCPGLLHHRTRSTRLLPKPTLLLTTKHIQLKAGPEMGAPLSCGFSDIDFFSFLL